MDNNKKKLLGMTYVTLRQSSICGNERTLTTNLINTSLIMSCPSIFFWLPIMSVD